MEASLETRPEPGAEFTNFPVGGCRRFDLYIAFVRERDAPQRAVDQVDALADVILVLLEPGAELRHAADQALVHELLETQLVLG